LPVPPEEVEASHEAFDPTVQAHAALLVVTATLPVPAPETADALVGAMA